MSDVCQGVGEDLGFVRQWLLLLAVVVVVVVISRAAASPAAISLLAAAHVGEGLAQGDELAVHVHPVALLDDVVGEFLPLVSLGFLRVLFLRCVC